jgi:hypothetical protein
LSGTGAGSDDPLPGRTGAWEETRGRGAGTRRRAGGVELLPRAVFAILVLACFAALMVTQRLKHTPTLVQGFKLTPSFAPISNGSHKLEAISFELTEADEVTVTIERSSGGIAATLVRDRPVGRYKRLSLRWNGREGAARGYSVLTSPHGYKSLLPANRGPVAPPGEYGVHVYLRARDRTIPSPRNFTLVRP